MLSLPFPFDRPRSLAQAVELACLLEATAPKLGNVHPAASFSDMDFTHFLASAVAIGPVFAQGALPSLGRLVLDSVVATREAVGRNTNLGTLLLFAPLAKAHALQRETCADYQSCLSLTLQRLSPDDCQDVYAAIRSALPGGLGEQAQDDIAGPAPSDLRIAMSTVADTDAVARQYTNDFADIFTYLVPWLVEDLRHTSQPLEALCRTQLRWLAHEPDGLIVRKAGMVIAAQVQQRAARLLPSCLVRSEPVAQRTEVQEFDRFLRSEGHRLNPGTTADLLAAAALVILLGHA